jgi:hypothetical protein
LEAGKNDDWFIKRAKEYFSDYKELVIRIEKGEFKCNDEGKVVSIYNEWKAKQKKK